MLSLFLTISYFNLLISELLQYTNISVVSFVYLKGVVAPIIHAKCA